tara:strand:+ start:114 stop:713 length:600 start_codon:yes stop_codon:yes gene_type:complete
MLGLGSGIIAPQAPSSRQLIGTYTADWSSGVDGWTDWTSNSGTWTFTRVASFGGKSNVLQVDITADETGNASGATKNTGLSTLRGDYLETTFDIYLDSTQGATDRWSGSDNVVTQVYQPGFDNDAFNIEQNKWASVSTVQGATLTNATLSSDNEPPDIPSGQNDIAIVYWTTGGDRPLNGARFYLCNYVVKHYRSQLFT